MKKQEHAETKKQQVPESVILTSKEMPDGEMTAKEVVIGNYEICLEGLSRKGMSDNGERKTSEDGCAVIHDEGALQTLVVDGGTQIEAVPTLDELELTGGRYITMMVERFGQHLNPSLNPVENLRLLNTKIGEDIRTFHPSISYQEYAWNTPYASIAAIKIDFAHNTFEVANAGDVFAVAVNPVGKPTLLSIDDVFNKDQRTFDAARRLAARYNVSFRQAMRQKTTERFSEIAKEMQETMRQGNVGLIRRLTGAPNFDVTSFSTLELENIKIVYLFTDGAILPGILLNTPEGLSKFYKFIECNGLQGLNRQIQAKFHNDPEYEQFPRFGLMDDFLMLKLTIQ